MTVNQNQYHANQETKRHNLAMEMLTSMQNAETRRANIAKETENTRSNKAREFENYRTNSANEGLTGFNFLNLRDHYARQDVEQKRSNEMREWQTQEKNAADIRLAEQGQGLEIMKMRESRRHNRAQEALQMIGTAADFASSISNGLGRALSPLLRLGLGG